MSVFVDAHPHLEDEEDEQEGGSDRAGGKSGEERGICQA